MPFIIIIGIILLIYGWDILSWIFNIIWGVISTLFNLIFVGMFDYIFGLFSFLFSLIGGFGIISGIVVFLIVMFILLKR